MKLVFAIALGLAALGAAPALAQGADRYAITPVEGGVLRVDKLTGAVSMCTENQGEWSCKRVADDRAPEDYRALQESPPHDDMGEGGLMTKEEFDQAMDSLEYMMDRITGTAERLRQRRAQPQ